MHPLNGVSTQRGENMRETCARVLAAALLTGAIATVVGMATLADTPQAPARTVAAPASAVQRTVRLKVQTAPPHPRRARALVRTRTYRTPRPAAVPQTLIVVHPHRASPQRQRRLASVPAPAPAPASPAADPAPAAPPTPAEAPPSADPAPEVPDTSQGPGRHGQGHAYGHDKQDD